MTIPRLGVIRRRLATPSERGGYWSRQLRRQSAAVADIWAM
jgi:hypothetical protein